MNKKKNIILVSEENIENFCQHKSVYNIFSFIRKILQLTSN